MKKIVVVMVFFALFIVFAGEAYASRDKMVQKAQEVVDALVYTRDARTGLCFAVAINFTYAYTIYTPTAVPCDDRVMKQVGK